MRAIAWGAVDPSAGSVIAKVAEEVAGDDRDKVTVAVLHRIGELDVGDSALVCVVWSAHRALAFRVCAELVEGVKSEVPIWKKQLFADGTCEWVNSIG